MKLQGYCESCKKDIPKDENMICPDCKKRTTSVICPDCSRVWESKQTECEFCGCPIARYEKLELMSCEKCGRQMAYDAPVCFSCGRRLYDCSDNDVSQSSFSIGEPKYRVEKCGACGRRVIKSEEDICYKCGHHLKKSRMFYIGATILGFGALMVYEGYKVNIEKTLFWAIVIGSGILLFSIYKNYNQKRIFHLRKKLDKINQRK